MSNEENGKRRKRSQNAPELPSDDEDSSIDGKREVVLIERTANPDERKKRMEKVSSLSLSSSQLHSLSLLLLS